MEEVQKERQIKLIVPLEKEADDYPPVDYEELWSTPSGEGLFRIENIPFFARGLSRGDIVSAVADEEGLRVQEVVHISGHSTIRLLIKREEAVPTVIEKFERQGCDSETTFGKLVALDVPPTVPLEDLLEKLEMGFAQSEWEYEEACIREPEDASTETEGA
ncbi:MAG TPA: DUF4265 domain-containing protein [Myxococcaceae bacterium]|jgi:hypothetical protein